MKDLLDEFNRDIHMERSLIEFTKIVAVSSI
jgi:hypothetical protein